MIRHTVEQLVDDNIQLLSDNRFLRVALVVSVVLNTILIARALV